MRRSAELFEKAVELRGKARDVFLDRACGDDAALRTEVESLLEAHDAAGAFLAEPTSDRDEAMWPTPDPDDPSATRVQTPPPPPRTIGRYKLLEQIGEGGFGTVWMAEQREPVKRRVAVKIIKPGMDSGQVIARFEAERQALAMMDHPNIAKVFDGGTTDTGGPYFVMEYIKGVPILDYCDTERLDTRARLELFTQACHAVQHAHQKGIIHRDIKPSNVMITLHDGTPVVKVIDFGIAKATNAELTTRTLFTAHHQMLGTPAYMSPEQAEMSGLDIDTRSDIYSLGVLLYELLTGTTPFATEELLSRGFAEMMRIIREDEPQKPSTRLSSLGASGTRTAAQRHADPRRLGLILRGDLDWIVMKCLEKERARRYDTANGLADDIRRHLGDEPVAAGPPSTRYRFVKFIRRNRARVFAAVIIAAVFVLGAAGTIAGMLRAQSADATARALQPQADEYAARVLLEQVDTLWPPHPDPPMIADLEAWRVAARELTTGLADYRTRLEAVRRSGVAQGEGRLVFESPVDRSTHDLLSTLVAELEQLGDDGTGLLAADVIVPGYGRSVPMRLAFAQKMAAGFAEGGDYAAAWADARREIPAALADLNGDGTPEQLYRGLDLPPQMGLVPLGPDPVSGLWEFAHLLTGAPAERDADGTLIVTEETGLVLVLIPGGTFLMGAARPPQGRAHDVALSPYFISKYEMTQGQWMTLTGRNPSAYGPGPDAEWKGHWLASGAPPSLLHPVEQVSWRDCDEWLRRAGLTLPSEAQWECAARAGTRDAFSTGRTLASLEGAANLRDTYFESADLETWGNYESNFDDGSTVHWAVTGPQRPNGFGLYDVHGNVQEWCLDGHAGFLERYTEIELDPVVAATKDAKYVYRGGSWRTRAGPARSAARGFFPPDFFGSAMGVRPARAIDIDR